MKREIRQRINNPHKFKNRGIPQGKQNRIYFPKSRALPKRAFIICNEPRNPQPISKNQDYNPHGHPTFPRKTIPPTLLWLEQPDTARARTGTGSGSGRSESRKKGMQIQTVEVAPPSRPRTTSDPWEETGISSSKAQISPFLFLFISEKEEERRDKGREKGQVESVQRKMKNLHSIRSYMIIWKKCERGNWLLIRIILKWDSDG